MDRTREKIHGAQPLAAFVIHKPLKILNSIAKALEILANQRRLSSGNGPFEIGGN
ncbi:MAG TPA: hypothetical protein VFG14_04810 [Chthoniobacteraceae bacterium]|nr:hypothetical protein [Chthoniobacteraceae bacterium]